MVNQLPKLLSFNLFFSSQFVVPRTLSLLSTVSRHPAPSTHIGVFPWTPRGARAYDFFTCFCARLAPIKSRLPRFCGTNSARRVGRLGCVVTKSDNARAAASMGMRCARSGGDLYFEKLPDVSWPSCRCPSGTMFCSELRAAYNWQAGRDLTCVRQTCLLSRNRARSINLELYQTLVASFLNHLPFRVLAPGCHGSSSWSADRIYLT
ncbi:hypothetical protein CDEST_04212 [Colletotrichum destructivum]|uniref:Secreted protein n=1 Tax=Colletotrichum destructivum TaxID=34406 RepID=A0AAX4I8F6_9PEZI|nr:hypothetical protein CDEST_04212 [Colletotrichum destructivum]